MEAARQERAEVLALCRGLDDDEWQTPSAAAGWRVQDVIAHLGSVCRALFHRDAMKISAAARLNAPTTISSTSAAPGRRHRHWPNTSGGVAGD
jgi:uncharacterized protein (TIGR03083 family)